ncbi:conserved hypothetical protein [Leishmania major strain Friedlin]|uniref:Uncharacterized protein n=1 Tax=Leishmania major TaxID=5664 RepID=Q4Q365_LEIMA|nr:conserved hypothetical protein [Leishmania major strain Friedlin]CAG9581996.1 hypothetical_protein_-_conserved [Leishmania major strain Friedlin]CAJ07847.1 conserved hypothetical protein [Leishmania major strain Friedlin]|eukprot:XP_001686233.1 conserved hypothetical protein [Leishmania major strain Friedlin]
MFRVHRPAGPSCGHLSDPSLSSESLCRAVKLEGQPKRGRTPCEDEVDFKKLQARKLDAQSRLRQQIEVLSGLESNVLDFYYTHMVRFEPLLELASQTSPSEAMESVSARDAVLGGNFAELFPELKSTTTLTDTCDESATLSTHEPAPSPSAAVPAKTRYYYDSALMRLYREAAFHEKNLAHRYACEKARVAATELSVQRDIVDGSLAEQLRTEHEEQEALNKLIGSLAEVTAQCAAHQQSLQVTDERIREIGKAREACLARKTVLEAKKQEQMDNAEHIKEEVAAFRRCVEGAAHELERRRRINRSLEDEIGRRRAALKRRKKE